MKNKFQLTTFILFVLLLVTSVIFNITKQASLINWSEIILIFVIMFVVFGDKITKLVISPKEISIEQTVEQKVEALKNDITKIDEFIEKDNPTAKITDIVDDTLEHSRDTWSQLLLIRMTLRRLLRKIADSRGMNYSPTASISGMIHDLHQQGFIDDFLVERMEKIRNATFTVEWGAGEPPELKDIKFTLENYAKVFADLKESEKNSKKKVA